MSGRLLIDNWLLQDVGNAFENGLTDDECDELVIDRAADTHRIQRVLAAGVQTEALLSLLLEIVLRDTLYVDSDFVSTWEDSRAHFDALSKSGLLRPIPFGEQEHLLTGPRNVVVQQLCVTSSLRQEQQRNEESWRIHRRPQNPYLSAAVWGTAGYLSRSHVFQAPYSGHPLRRRVIEQTLKQSIRPDILSDTVSWIAGERLRVFESVDNKSRQALMILPAMVIDVIEEANTTADLIPVAIQIREKYVSLRGWIRTVEDAVEAEDTKAIAKFKKTLANVEKDVSREMGISKGGEVSLKISIKFLGLSVPIGTLDGVMKKFGIRAILNKCIFSERGEKSLGKLFEMFDVPKQSGLALAVRQYLASKSGK